MNAATEGRAEMLVGCVGRSDRQCERELAREHKRAGEICRRADQTIIIGRMAGARVPGRTSGRWLCLGDSRSWHPGEIAQVDVAERQSDLQRQRKQRERSSKSAIGPNPAHREGHVD